MGRYTRKGVSKIFFCATLSSQTAPSIATDLTTANDITAAISEISGFQFSNDPISTPDLSTLFVSQIPGEDSAEDSAITYYDDDTTTTLRTAQAKGNAGFIVLCPYGKVTSKRAEVWPVKSTGVNDEWTTDNEAARMKVQFAVTATPNQGATIAA
jgi:hypothetical protein